MIRRVQLYLNYIGALSALLLFISLAVRPSGWFWQADAGLILAFFMYRIVWLPRGRPTR
ncbi:MAG: hypothetical protein WBE77_10965 [Candidatus Cybelea sp.]